MRNFVDNVTPLKPLKFWCQKVLPLVYDDSLSYYEVLCKLTSYVNKLIEDVKAIEDGLDEYVLKWLEQYGAESVSNWLANYGDEVINEWLDEHPEATTTVQDGAITAVKLARSLYEALLNYYVTPQQFGAMGNGVTDDSVAFHDAIATGLPVIVPVGTYLVDSVEITSDTQIIGCDGAVIKAMVYTEEAGSVEVIPRFANIFNSDGHNVEIKNIEFEGFEKGNKSVAESEGYKLGVLDIHNGDLTINNCKFTNFYNRSTINGAGDTYVSRHGVVITHTNGNFEFSENVIKNVGGEEIIVGCENDTRDRCCFEKNTLEDCNGWSVNLFYSNLKIANNVVRRFYSDATIFNFFGITGVVDNNLVYDTVCRDVFDCCENTTLWCGELRVTNNHVEAKNCGFLRMCCRNAVVSGNYAKTEYFVHNWICSLYGARQIVPPTMIFNGVLDTKNIEITSNEWIRWYENNNTIYTPTNESPCIRINNPFIELSESYDNELCAISIRNCYFDFGDNNASYSRSHLVFAYRCEAVDIKNIKCENLKPSSYSSTYLFPFIFGGMNGSNVTLENIEINKTETTRNVMLYGNLFAPTIDELNGLTAKNIECGRGMYLEYVASKYYYIDGSVSIFTLDEIDRLKIGNLKTKVYVLDSGEDTEITANSSRSFTISTADMSLSKAYCANINVIFDTANESFSTQIKTLSNNSVSFVVFNKRDVDIAPTICVEIIGR